MYSNSKLLTAIMLICLAVSYGVLGWTTMHVLGGVLIAIAFVCMVRIAQRDDDRYGFPRV